VLAAVYAGVTDELPLSSVIFAAAGGAILGDNIGYWIGHRYGRRALERYGRHLRLTEARIELAQRMFVRHGGKVVFLARFFTLLRTLGAFLAGLNGMWWPRFAACNAAGAIVWAAAFGFGAYALGDQAHRVLHSVGVISFVVALAALIVVVWLVRRRRRRWSSTVPYCKALPPSARKS